METQDHDDDDDIEYSTVSEDYRRDLLTVPRMLDIFFPFEFVDRIIADGESVGLGCSLENTGRS